MELTGKNVNLATSGLEVLPVWNEAQSSFNGDTNFFPDIAISDLYWGRTNYSPEFRLNSAALWNGSTARALGYPFPGVTPFGNPSFTLPNPWADSYTNSVAGEMSLTVTNQDGEPVELTIITNMAKGAIFVGAPSDFGVQVGFTDVNPDTGLMTANVVMWQQFSNVVTARLEPAFVFIEDRLGSGGTTGVLSSAVGCPPYATSRPANYIVSRDGFYPGDPGGAGYPPADFFLVSGNTDPLITEDGVTNATVQAGELTAYSAYVDNVVIRPLPVVGGTVTNLPGRIRITGDNLDLSGTRMRAEGQIIIKSSHLISSSNAVIDCENLSFNLASTNGTLQVTNLSKDTVNRLTGTIRVWSTVWSNTAELLIENYSIDTNNTPPATLSPVSNTVSMVFHTLMVDARALSSTLPVTVFDFATHSTNVVINDNMTMGEAFLVDGKSLTLNANLTIPGVVPVVNPGIGVPPPGEPMRDFTAANAPNLLYFTNRGSFFINNDAHLGDDRPQPYARLINSGTINGWSLQARSDYLQNSGSLIALSTLGLQCGSGNFDGGDSTSGGDSHFMAGSLKFNDYQMTVNGGLYFMATNALYDAGGGASNAFTVQNGFHLQIKPQTGDLFGTALTTAAPNVPATTIDHTWAGLDLGPSAAGYTNNTALGKLVVTSQSRNPLFYFSGTGSQNGLYVDLLDLSALGTNYQRWIAIDPNLTIYFAAAKLGFTPPKSNNVPQPQAEEFLDGKFGGRLRWVRDFAGPNSATPVLINGQTVMVNRALRNSLLIDSNTNGIPNFNDPYPFSASVTLTASLVGANQPVPNAVAISWMAAPQTVYRVEYATSPALNNWQPLLTYTNTALTNKLVSVSDTNPPAGSGPRFYRVGFNP